ncbi:hypothetical protein S83_063389 [Arachis hypogaea]
MVRKDEAEASADLFCSYHIGDSTEALHGHISHAPRVHDIHIQLRHSRSMAQHSVENTSASPSHKICWEQLEDFSAIPNKFQRQRAKVRKRDLSHSPVLR